MDPQLPVKKTSLHAWHLGHGARMAAFAGYDMPLWYDSPKNEHLAVLKSAGLFDTSHMAIVMASGKDAFDLLQWCFTKDLSACIGRSPGPLTPGRCVYGAFLNPEGGVIDDAVIYRLAPEEFMIVVNAGMGPTVAAHLRSQQGGRFAAISDLTGRVGKIDLQGPASAKILKQILKDPDTVFEQRVYFSFKGHFDAASPLSRTVGLADGLPVMVSRTGYTGEFGFEIYTAIHHLEDVWRRLAGAGSEFGLSPCGLAARDSLRTGALLPLSHQDIGPWPYIHHPWEFTLPFTGDKKGFTKPFMGDRALLSVTHPEFTCPFAGEDVRKVTLPAEVLLDGKAVGTVLTCVTDVAIGWRDGRITAVHDPDLPEGYPVRGLSCGFIRVRTPLFPNQAVALSDGKRTIPVKVVPDIRPCRSARRPISEFLQERIDLRSGKGEKHP